MTAAPRALRVPPDAGQHTTAGPYSPVIEVTPGKLVVISGQGAITPDGSVTPGGIREQTHATLDNCRRQLRHAGADFADVFKVNVYLRDLSDWPAFNDAYAEVMPQPLPVRTAVGADLLLTLRVELEMWAVLP
ncbi:RidA family protein (plasmid) [Embleya sp. NBC_00888]|uniref:RidA family protein n=1 Tax=Embleya sp. NBC_00888 TaxID=2975960 RepID=UPI002F9081ED|nr:RidA family protein [Embleya sp. NBC_00888]